MSSLNIEIFQRLYEDWIEDDSTKLDSEHIFDLLLEYLENQKKEICGKCTPCRDGVPKIEKFIEDFKNGKADLNTLKHFTEYIKNLRGSKCSVGLDIGKNLEVVLDNNYESFYDIVKGYKL